MSEEKRAEEMVVRPDDDCSTKARSQMVDKEGNMEAAASLRGYKDKRSGVEYVHACVQQGEGKVRDDFEEKICEKLAKNTQTPSRSSHASQTGRDCSTQVVKRGFALGNSEIDRKVDVGEYVDSEETQMVKSRSITKIQKICRRFLARQHAFGLRKSIMDAFEEEQRFLAEFEKEEKEQYEREVERRTNPRTAADFEILYNELDNWRHHETLAIKSNKNTDDETRKTLLKELLEKEVELLQKIDRMKAIASKENREKRIRKMLENFSAPKKWQISNGDTAVVHTELTQRAAELKDLYIALRNNDFSIDDRLKVLLHVKWTVKEFDNELIRDLIDLLDREADLLNRGRKGSAMQGLRRRILSLFLELIQTPQFNPEAAKISSGEDPKI